MKVRGTPSLLLMLCLTGLAACSSKPDSADIQKELAQMYQCPLLSMSEVKKTDGAEGQGKQYEVAFAYTVTFRAARKRRYGSTRNGRHSMPRCCLRRLPTSTPLTMQTGGYRRRTTGTSPMKKEIETLT